MTDLSPAAQAVLTAAIEIAESPDAEAIAAAVLRAAANHCNPEWTALTCLHSILAIAAELEKNKRHETLDKG